MTTHDILLQALDFVLDDVDGHPFRLSALRGQHVILVFNRGFT